MIDVATLIPKLALFMLPVSAVYVAFAAGRARAAMGALRQSFTARPSFQFIGILLLTPTLIALNFIRYFDALTVFAISGVGVLGFHVAARELSFALIAGIYENGVVVNGAAVFFETVDSAREEDPHTALVVFKDRATKRLFSGDIARARSILAAFRAFGIPAE
jgi:hypothetical protein